MFMSSFRKWKNCDRCDFNRGMDAGARWTGLGILKIAYLLGFSSEIFYLLKVPKVHKVHTEWCKKGSHSLSGGSAC